MSFWPFPTNLLAELRAAQSRGPLVELGCGRGDLLARLRQAGLDPWGLEIAAEGDRRRPWIRADAARLPFADGSIGGFVLADVLRHLPVPVRGAVADETLRALVPQGRVILLEDSPVAHDEAEALYRETMRLLAAADPSRGTVRSLDEWSEPWRMRCGPARSQGRAANDERVRRPTAPLDWIMVRRPDLAEAARELRARVEMVGMAYGDYQWCVFTAEDAA